MNYYYDDGNSKYLQDEKQLKEYFEYYMVDYVNSQEKYDRLLKEIDNFSYNDLVLFKCLTDTFTWWWAKDLMKDSKLMKTINEIIQ